MDVPSQIYQLQKVTFASDAPESVMEKYQFFFMRILSSRVSQSIYDDDTLQTEMTRVQINWQKSKSLRFQELFTRLTRSRSLIGRNAVLQMLLKLSHLKDNKSIDSLFRTSKDTVVSVSSHSTSLNHMKKSIMEIENGLNHTLRVEPKVKVMDPSPFMKTVKSITDKGNQQIQLKEFDLVSDCLYAFQGIEGHYINFDPAADGFTLRKDVAVSTPSRKLVNQLCEMGWLFKKINTYLVEQSGSLIQQALQNGIKEEMNEYYRLIAILENMLQQQESSSTLTLRKLYLWARNPHTQMINLGVLISSISHPQQLQGQAAPPAVAISTLVALSSHGCMTAHHLYLRLLASTCVPLIRFINQWVFEGTLSSTEFFVERQERINTKDVGELWKREFYVRQERVPSIIKRSDAKLIFDTGRVVNWVHRQCQLKTWHLDLPTATVDQLLQSMKLEPMHLEEMSFNDWIWQANKIANLKLMELIFQHFKFDTHLQAIKRYLLLGQGEFIHTLMEIMSAELSKPASTIYRHNLIGLLESAIRASNVQYLPQEIVMRLDVKLLEANQGDTGWEIFSLDYKLDEPLNTILNQKAMMNYLRIFNFLWRVKRVEYTIAQIWKLHMKSKYKGESGKKSQLLSLSIRHEMQHFIQNFYNYIMVEAVETAWTKFQEELSAAKDLDSVIVLHEQFQSDVLDRAFLSPRNESIYRQLLKVFELIFRFKFIQEIIVTEQQPTQSQDTHKLLTELQREYKVCISELQDKLKKDEKLKFLSFRLDFNEYYFTLNTEAHFKLDLDKFVGMYIQPTTQSQHQSQQPVLSQQHPNQSQPKKLTSTINLTKIAPSPPPPSAPQPASKSSFQVMNQQPLQQNFLQPVFPQQPQHQHQNRSGTIRSQNEPTDVQQGLRMLEEQRKSNQHLAYMAKKQLQNKIEEEPAVKVGMNYFHISREEHDRMKNDDEDGESSQDNQNDDDDEDDQ